MKMKNITKIRIGTRGSKLALAQAHLVQKMLLEHYPNLITEIVTIKTTGDKILEKNLSEIGGKGLFIKEIEEQMIEGEIDIAVHSMKDIPAFVHDDLEIPCILEREDPSDAFISEKYSKIADLPEGAILGTSSPRRAAQALNKRPDLKVVPFRGNIHTRLEKLKKNEADATFLAIAGLKRSGMLSDIAHPIEFSEMLPAVSQGAIGIQTRKKDFSIKEIIAKLHHAETFTAITAERGFLIEFEGSCRTPIAALACIKGDKIELNCLICSLDGKKMFKTMRNGCINDDVAELGRDAAIELKQKTGPDFLT